MPKKKIVISEDDEYVLDYISYVLRVNNFEIDVAYDGQQALNITREKKPDIVILDLMSPKFNAFQICEQLDKDVRTRGIPRILMTALPIVEIENKIEKFGIYCLIKKPFSSKELLDSINEIIAKKGG